MIILGIESSCDETSAAILEKKENSINILSNIIGTSSNLQEKYGGVIPERAAREQLKTIIPVIEEALSEADKTPQDIDVIAVTYGPGLIGSLLVGVETAKVLALTWNKPLIPVNHLIGHLYANWIESENNTIPKFPAIGLLVSGGHTDLVLFKEHNNYTYLGGTLDDAAGECFDKSARLLGYPYPGGPKISKLAEQGDPKAFNFPRPLIGSKDFNFSFSGLKTAFATYVRDHFNVESKVNKIEDITWHQQEITGANQEELANLCASIEQAILDCLIKKTVKAAQMNNIEQIFIAGGVSANKKLFSQLKDICDQNGLKLSCPPPILCTDNAAMIAAAAFFSETKIDPPQLQANPNLSLQN